jgi:hypothetical protein
MELTATIRQRAVEGAKNVDGLAMEIITASAEDYDSAWNELERQLPDGWQMLGIRRQVA